MSLFFYIIILVFVGSFDYDCGGGFDLERMMQAYNIFFCKLNFYANLSKIYLI
jgi:hypothetical protein